MISFSFLRISLVCIVLVLCQSADGRHDPKWVKPGALDRWGQQQKDRLRGNPGDTASCEVEPQECNCPPPPEPPPPTPCDPEITEDQRLALVFYRKLVRTLFARDTLQVDPVAEDFLVTDHSLRISTRQLEKLLDESTTARELNLIVSAILEQSDNTQRKLLFRESQCERLYEFAMQLFESSILHNLLPVLLLITACYAIRMISRITRLHPILVFLLLILSITVCNKWKECNENLAKKSLQNMENAHKTSWNIKSVLGMGTRNDGALPIAVCDPLQVLIESTVSIQGFYFKSIFKEYLTAYTEFTQDTGFFEKLLVGALMLGFVYVIITSLGVVSVRSGFQMFGNVVTSALHSSGAQQPAQVANGQPPQQLPAMNLNIHIGDGSAARSIALGELLRQESQRIEVVSEEAAASMQAIQQPTVSKEETTKCLENSNEAKEELEEPKSSKVGTESQTDEK